VAAYVTHQVVATTMQVKEFAFQLDETAVISNEL
jgi:hypothetical protein